MEISSSQCLEWQAWINNAEVGIPACCLVETLQIATNNKVNKYSIHVSIKNYNLDEINEFEL